jgi:hypothetical protein
VLSAVSDPVITMLVCGVAPDAIAFKDSEGKPLSGDVSHKLALPPNVPANLFWSLTLYEAENASGLATEARRFPSLGSRDKPIQNPDGTTDLFIARQERAQLVPHRSGARLIGP